MNRIGQKSALSKSSGQGETHMTLQASGRMKRLTLDIPEVLHREIKKNAAHEGVTMAEKLRALLLDHYGLANGDGSK